MINKASKIKLVVIIALSLMMVPATAQRREQAGTTAGKTLVMKERHGDHTRTVRRERHRYNPEEFRKLMQAELTHLPALNKRMERLMDIQARRYDLQKQRQATAKEGDRDRDAVVRKFHKLLRQDLDLSKKTREIVDDIVGDMPRIKEQLDKRRSVLQAELDKISQSDESTSESKTRDAHRRMRYLDFLEKKLEDLRTDPERLDLLARVLRGLPPENPSSVHDDKTPHASDTITDLRRKRKKLQGELRQVEKKLKDLRRRNISDETTGTRSAK